MDQGQLGQQLDSGLSSDRAQLLPAQEDIMNGKRLLAGAAEVDITPKMGTQIAGDIGRRRPAEILIDPIFAKALVLDDGQRKLCVLSLDLCIVTREWGDKIRSGAQERFGLDPDAVMVHPVQNHAAPSLGHCVLNFDSEYFPPEFPWLNGGDDEYHPIAVERVLEAIGLALEAMQPVRVGLASGVENRVAFNRRFVMRDGTAEMGFRSHEPSDVAYNEGPIDPELGVVSFTTESLRPVALLLHHTCHPVHGYPERYITAGWPGAWSSGIRSIYGDGCVPLVINGCCGNVHHRNYLNREQVDTAELMGATLTEATVPVLKQLVYQDDSGLGYATRLVQIPLRQVPEQQLAEASKLLAEHPEPVWKEGLEGIAADWDWVYAVGRLDLDRRVRQDPNFEYEIQAFRIGDFALVAVMGEVFVEGQLRMKMESPAARTFVAHMSHGYVGYVPTPHALERGGYETWTANWSKLVPEALDMIVDNSVDLLNELFS
jgi:hypothetical protein